MATRRPVVLIAGDLAELPNGDTVTGAGSGGGGTVTTVTVDFGAVEDGTASTTIADTSVTAGSTFAVTPAGTATQDHDADDYAAEGVTGYAANVAPGVGYDVIASAPRGTFGQYNFSVEVR